MVSGEKDAVTKVVTRLLQPRYYLGNSSVDKQFTCFFNICVLFNNSYDATNNGLLVLKATLNHAYNYQPKDHAPYLFPQHTGQEVQQDVVLTGKLDAD